MDFRTVANEVWRIRRQQDRAVVERVREIAVLAEEALSQRTRASELGSALHAIAEMYRSGYDDSAEIQGTLISLVDKGVTMGTWNDPQCPYQVVERIWRDLGITRSNPSPKAAEVLFAMSEWNLDRMGTECVASLLRSWASLVELQVPAGVMIRAVDALFNREVHWRRFNTEYTDLPIAIICLRQPGRLTAEGLEALLSLETELVRFYQR